MLVNSDHATQTSLNASDNMQYNEILVGHAYISCSIYICHVFHMYFMNFACILGVCLHASIYMFVRAELTLQRLPQSLRLLAASTLHGVYIY